MRTGLAEARHAVWSSAASCCTGAAGLPSPAGAMMNPLARVNARPAHFKHRFTLNHWVPSAVLRLMAGSLSSS